MLEILLLIYLCKKVGEIVRDKGRSGAGWFQFLMVGMWFGGEAVGFVAGAVMTGDADGGAYAMGLLGAAAGATATFVIVKSLAPAGDALGRRGFDVTSPYAP